MKLNNTNDGNNKNKSNNNNNNNDYNRKISSILEVHTYTIYIQ